MAERAVDELLARVRPGNLAGVATVDLRSLHWVPPSVMVAVAAQAHEAGLAGTPFAVRAPLRKDPAEYAARMRLGRVLDELGARHDFPTVREHDQREHLIELTAIDGGPTVDRLAALVHGKLRRRDGELARALHKSVGEIAENVTDHAGTIGFVAAQTLPRRKELLLAIGDAGVGMLATLAHRGAGTDEHAIELAIRDEVSRYDAPDRGRGLPTTLRLIGRERGNVYIASGTASIRHFPTTRRYLRHPPGYRGTIVEARIPLAPREDPPAPSSPASPGTR